MKNLMYKMFFIVILPSWAIAASTTGIGGVAENLMDPVSVFSDFIESACFIIGGSFILASIVKYIEHRRSPLMVSFSTVVFLFIAGLILILLPLISYLSSSSIKDMMIK